MTFFTPENIRSAVGGVFRTRPGVSSLSGGVGIDTRTLKPGQIFAAFKGEHTDGHAYLKQARAAGSTLAIVEAGAALPGDVPEDMTLIEVESTRAALGKMATAYRKTFSSTRVIAVTGSNGKTTTVRLIDHVLGSVMQGSASIKSYNNDIGLPLTILGAKPNDKYVVCELGMSAPGEVAQLAQIATPDIGVITSVGLAHLERFDGPEGIAKEKASILQGLAPGGLGVVSADSAGLAELMPPNAQLVRFGLSEDADLRVMDIEEHAGGLSFSTNGGQRYELGLLGRHNAINAAAAIAVARRLGMQEGDIAQALASARGPEMRLDRRRIGEIEIINDAYNANPDSVRAAVGTLGSVASKAKRRVLVLGEMLELGESASRLHEEIGGAIAEQIRAGTGPDLVVLVGELAHHAQAPIINELGKAAVVLESKTGDGRSIAKRLVPGDAVLLKGSRSVGLERVAHAVQLDTQIPEASAELAKED